ncbi:hypothetical protein K503DRAFT_803903 [Rhizopogon vinicolor AM-OR11-026]|uniref:Uncharacterized protein n=1 Tax=Rhizopogon vinicolor AM-OR11-026 TaxID=1314800 RepID=A0A1B7MN96_9AGAM|nr:hypothetical protein K503DRAFT_803903 [Rhizopogon vinicolor AM-OR11-026]
MSPGIYLQLNMDSLAASFQPARNLFSRTPLRCDEGIELQDRRSAAVDVPLAKGKPRNYSAREVRMKRKREKEKEKAMAAKNASSRSSRPQSNVTQQSGGTAQGQPSSELHAAVATSSTTPAVVSTSALSPSTTSLPDAMIPRAGRWTRFWLFFRCASAQYTNGHH